MSLRGRRAPGAARRGSPGARFAGHIPAYVPAAGGREGSPPASGRGVRGAAPVERSPGFAGAERTPAGGEV
jgi:hypothetical protein